MTMKLQRWGPGVQYFNDVSKMKFFAVFVLQKTLFNEQWVKLLFGTGKDINIGITVNT